MTADTVAVRPMPRAFISYSWDDEDHRDWVTGLATRLRGDGVDDEVSMPLLDGTRGSALYRVPFQLSSRPSAEWAQAFIHTWNRPPSFTTMHRPGTASVEGDRIVLNRTTIEVGAVHRDTLALVVNEANRLVEEHERAAFERQQAQLRTGADHERRVREAARKILVLASRIIGPDPAV